MNVLLLAGTAEARDLATLVDDDPRIALTASLAGRTSSPAGYPCPVRTGGFGGVDGLVEHLLANVVDALVDATHPFSSTMPRHAAAAASRAGVPRLRLLRPPWQPRPGDAWHDADDLAHAARLLVELGARSALLTVGRLELSWFDGIDARLVVRTIEPPDPMPLRDAEVIRARGPFTVEDEVRLLRDRHVDIVVTKNSGGDDAKLVAARRLGLPIVVVRRPPAVPGPTVATAAAAREWILAAAS